jgi:hypothetical protein
MRTIEQYFRVLGLEPGATLADVKKAHRFLVQTFHEDKYPDDSPHKEKAREKMIAINEAYAELKTFFIANPDGVPAGGWGQGTSDQFSNNSSDEMDWQNWQSRQNSSAGDEIKQWQVNETARREALKVDESKNQRRLIGVWGRVAVWLSLYMMWSGHGCSGSINQAGDDWNLQYAKQTMEYKLQRNEATEADLQRLRHMKEQYNKDANAFNMSFIFLYGFGAVLLYLTFATKPKNALANWVDTGSFVWSDVTPAKEKEAVAS